MGFCARKLKQNELAAYAFERFLEWEPGNEQMTQLALITWKHLVALQRPFRPLKGWLLSARASGLYRRESSCIFLLRALPLESQRETEHFTLRFRADEYEDLAEFSLNLLEEAHDELVSSFGFPALRQRIEVIFNKIDAIFLTPNQRPALWPALFLMAV